MEGLSLLAKLVSFMGVVYTAGATRDGLGNRKVVTCFLSSQNNDLILSLPLKLGWWAG